MRPVSRDYYEILGLDREASPDDIKKAYRRLAREYHPDVNNGDAAAEERFKDLGEAYTILSDPDKRRHYDHYGATSPADFGYTGGFPDIFEIFNEAFGFSGGGRRRSAGRDLQVEVNLELEEVLTGAQRVIPLSRRVHCETCRGSGARPGAAPAVCPGCQGAGRVRQVHNSLFGNMVTVVACSRCGGQGQVITDPCEACEGSGRTVSEEEFTVDIPPGIESGQHLEYEGSGDAGEGGPPGSLYVRVTVAPHPHLIRDGIHLHSLLTVSFPQAALGDRVTVTALEGETEVTVPAGVQSGEQIRLAGKGLPHLRRRGRGDQIITVRVVTPSPLTERQRELLEQLAVELGDGPPAAPPETKSFFERLKETLGGGDSH